MWAKLWRTPQAAAWVQLAVWPATVGLYVRHSVLAADGDLKAAAEARHGENALGLNPDAMLRKRWKLAGDETAVKRETRKPAARSSVKARLKAIDGGQG